MLVVDEDPDILELLLLYLYTGEYPDKSFQSCRDLVTDAKLYIMADKYLIKALQAAIEKPMKSTNSTADQVKQWIEAVHVTYANTSPNCQGLRNHIARYTWQNKDLLLSRTTVKKKI